MRKFLLLLLAITVVSGLVLGTSSTVPVASASSTGYGSQIQFSCNGATYGAVKGYNQNGDYVTWEGDAYGGTFKTYGWYWVGTVRAHWWQNGTWKSTNVWVPDWVLSPEWWVATC